MKYFHVWGMNKCTKKCREQENLQKNVVLATLPKHISAKIEHDQYVKNLTEPNHESIMKHKWMET